MAFILSALWWRKIRGLWKLPDERDWLWGNWGLILMGEAMLRRSLIQFSVDGLSCVPFLLLDLKPNHGRANDSNQFSSVQLLSRVRLFVTTWIAARQASLSITNSRSSLKLMSIESVMPSSHLILCHPLLLLPPIPPSIRVFSNESTLLMRWPKYWSFTARKFYSVGLWTFFVNMCDSLVDNTVYWPCRAKPDTFDLLFPG